MTVGMGNDHRDSVKPANCCFPCRRWCPRPHASLLEISELRVEAAGIPREREHHMRSNPHRAAPCVISFLAMIVLPRPCAAQAAAALPDGVKAVWDLAGAWREATPTRERVCVNGLWSWQPSLASTEALPTLPCSSFLSHGVL